MTGIPDAVVEAAWREWNQKHAGERASFLAGFAAAEGPWRDHLATQIEAVIPENYAHGCGLREAAQIVRGTNEAS